MVLRSLDISLKDASDLFSHLKMYRAKTKLDFPTTRAAVVIAVQQVLDQYADDIKYAILVKIARATLDELMKSVEVDEAMLIKCLELYPGVGETDEDDIRKLSLKSEFPGKKEAEEEPLPLHTEVQINKIATKALQKYGEAGIETMKRESEKMRFSLKQGQEEQMLRHIIFFLTKSEFRVYSKHALQSSLELFMKHLQAYAATFCVLKDLETVHRAIENVDLSLFQDFKELEEISVPIQEEDSVTLINKMKPEEYMQTENCGSSVKRKSFWYVEGITKKSIPNTRLI